MGTDPGAGSPNWLQVWVEAGRDGQIFTYANPRGLALAVGDLVQVRLRGRRQSGLVVALLAAAPADLDPGSLRPIELLLQAAAVLRCCAQSPSRRASCPETDRLLLVPVASELILPT